MSATCSWGLRVREYLQWISGKNFDEFSKVSGIGIGLRGVFATGFWSLSVKSLRGMPGELQKLQREINGGEEGCFNPHTPFETPRESNRVREVLPVSLVLLVQQSILGFRIK